MDKTPETQAAETQAKLQERVETLEPTPGASEAEAPNQASRPSPRVALQMRIRSLTERAAQGTNQAAGQARAATGRALAGAAKFGREASKRAGPALERTQKLAGTAVARTKDATSTALEISRTKVLPRVSDLLARMGRRLRPARLEQDYRALLAHLHGVLFDRAVEKLFYRPTKGRVSINTLTLRSTNREYGHDYRPSPKLVVDWAVAAIGEDLRNLTFFDHGAGKGRAMLVAAHHPFAAIRGIEFAEELHADANLNLAQFPRSRMKCRDVECTLGDTADATPFEGEAVHYFFNPFEPAIFSRVLSRLAASYRNHPRRLYLALVDFPDTQVVEGSGIFQRVKLPPQIALKLALFSPYRIDVFRSTV
jgi:hypothetical protein